MRIFQTSLLLSLVLAACQPQEIAPQLEVYQSSASGDRLKKLNAVLGQADFQIDLDSTQHFQRIEGFGGAITESSAHLIQALPADQRQALLAAYFSDSASAYNLARLHINSCDFSLSSYAYVTEGDTTLNSFDLAPDRDDIIPTAQQALALADGDLRFFASPWTAPPWMKDNKHWYGGKLLPKYYDLWAQYFVKYAQAYADEGLPIWGFTIENEPLGNDANWESMHFSPEEMAQFIKGHLAPTLKAAGLESQLFIYDQNRGKELEEWADHLLSDSSLLPEIYGTAVHWYTSTYKWFPESLQHTHKLAPGKQIWNTEACVDAEVPHWQDDAWYWKKEATDWGYTWAPESDKPDHPKYVPVYRYARDIIGCLNNEVSAWVDWNIVLDRQGGPNHASNWCVAPVIVDTASAEIYYTPLYDALRHFSHFIKAGAYKIQAESNLPEGVHFTAVRNPDGSLALVVLNTTNQELNIELKLEDQQLGLTAIAPAALQSLVIPVKGKA
ncbi:glycoside hydrolase family 30 protein [Croceimicrobium sp.]|uniref:glycoside hydrolase family 30 protein n=1 Tax=Croceimicrobium sp. TaxID=2828340 RepID=UPI003BAB87D1